MFSNSPIVILIGGTECIGAHEHEVCWKERFLHMADAPPITVTTSDGQQGVIIHPAELSDSGDPKILVRFGDSQELYVLTDLLLEQRDGNFRLPISLQELQQRQSRIH